MTDATTEFFDELEARGHEPGLEKMTGTLRFDLVMAIAWRGGSSRSTRGTSPSHTRTSGPTARCVPRGRSSTASPAGRSMPSRPCCVEPWTSKVGQSSSCSSNACFLRHRSRAYERWPRQGPRRQHVRRQRLARRHRGVADRPDRPLLVRQPLPLDVDPDSERRAAQSAVGGRSAVLRVALLPRPGHRARVCRFQAVRDSPTGGRRRLPRGADDPQPRHQAG
jgi:hypothetical protein